MDIAKKITKFGVDATGAVVTSGVDQLNWLASTDGIQTPMSDTADLALFSPSLHYPSGTIHTGMPLARHAVTGLLGPYTGTTSEVQQVAITGAPSGGTWTLTFNGQTTAAIPYNATANTVRTALLSLSSIGGIGGGVQVSGGPGPSTPFVVTFEGALGENAQNLLVASRTFTGGTSPNVVVTRTTAGGNDTDPNLGRLHCLLFSPVPGRASGRVGVAVLYKCIVRRALLPRWVDANGMNDVAGRIVFV